MRGNRFKIATRGGENHDKFTKKDVEKMGGQCSCNFHRRDADICSVGNVSAGNAADRRTKHT